MNHNERNDILNQEADGNTLNLNPVPEPNDEPDEEPENLVCPETGQIHEDPDEGCMYCKYSEDQGDDR